MLRVAHYLGQCNARFRCHTPVQLIFRSNFRSFHRFPTKNLLENSICISVDKRATLRLVDVATYERISFFVSSKKLLALQYYGNVPFWSMSLRTLAKRRRDSRIFVIASTLRGIYLSAHTFGTSAFRASALFS